MTSIARAADRHRATSRRSALAALVALGVLAPATSARAQRESGIQITPDSAR